MARAFDDGSSQYLQVGSTPVSAAPLSVAAWFKTDDLTADQTIIFGRLRQHLASRLWRSRFPIQPCRLPRRRQQRHRHGRTIGPFNKHHRHRPQQRQHSIRLLVRIGRRDRHLERRPVRRPGRSACPGVFTPSN
jgi:hypothetical protein